MSKIESLGNNTFNVPSESILNLKYLVDMEIGLCSCPVGRTRGPCKHKHVVSTSFNLPSFDILPTQNAEMRKFYNFLGVGKEEHVSWFRPLNEPDKSSVNPIGTTELRTEHEQPSSSSMSIDSSEVIDSGEADRTLRDDENNHEMKEFLQSLDELKDTVKNRFQRDPVNYANALRAFKKQCDLLIKGNDAMVQKSLHNFGKEQTMAAVKGRKKNGGRIPIQSRSKARRVFKMRGSGTAIQGRPTKDLSNTKSTDGDVVYYSLPKSKTRKKSRPHSLSTIVEQNLASDKKH